MLPPALLPPALLSALSSVVTAESMGPSAPSTVATLSSRVTAFAESRRTATPPPCMWTAYRTPRSRTPGALDPRVQNAEARAAPPTLHAAASPGALDTTSACRSSTRQPSRESHGASLSPVSDTRSPRTSSRPATRRVSSGCTRGPPATEAPMTSRASAGTSTVARTPTATAKFGSAVRPRTTARHPESSPSTAAATTCPTDAGVPPIPSSARRSEARTGVPPLMDTTSAAAAAPALQRATPWLARKLRSVAVRAHEGTHSFSFRGYPLTHLPNTATVSGAMSGSSGAAAASAQPDVDGAHAPDTSGSLEAWATRAVAPEEAAANTSASVPPTHRPTSPPAKGPVMLLVAADARRTDAPVAVPSRPPAAAGASMSPTKALQRCTTPPCAYPTRPPAAEPGAAPWTAGTRTEQSETDPWDCRSATSPPAAGAVSGAKTPPVAASTRQRSTAPAATATAPAASAYKNSASTSQSVTPPPAPRVPTSAADRGPSATTLPRTRQPRTDPSPASPTTAPADVVDATRGFTSVTPRTSAPGPSEGKSPAGPELAAARPRTDLLSPSKDPCSTALDAAKPQSAPSSDTDAPRTYRAPSGGWAPRSCSQTSSGALGALRAAASRVPAESTTHRPSASLDQRTTSASAARVDPHESNSAESSARALSSTPSEPPATRSPAAASAGGTSKVALEPSPSYTTDVSDSGPAGPSAAGLAAGPSTTRTVSRPYRSARSQETLRSGPPEDAASCSSATGARSGSASGAWRDHGPVRSGRSPRAYPERTTGSSGSTETLPPATTSAKASPACASRTPGTDGPADPAQRTTQSVAAAAPSPETPRAAASTSAARCTAPPPADEPTAVPATALDAATLDVWATESASVTLLPRRPASPPAAAVPRTSTRGPAKQAAPGPPRSPATPPAVAPCTTPAPAASAPSRPPAASPTHPPATVPAETPPAAVHARLLPVPSTRPATPPAAPVVAVTVRAPPARQRTTLPTEPATPPTGPAPSMVPPCTAQSRTAPSELPTTAPAAPLATDTCGSCTKTEVTSEPAAHASKSGARTPVIRWRAPS